MFAVSNRKIEALEQKSHKFDKKLYVAFAVTFTSCLGFFVFRVIKKLIRQLSKPRKGKKSKAFLGTGSVLPYRNTDNPD